MRPITSSIWKILFNIEHNNDIFIIYIWQIKIVKHSSIYAKGSASNHPLKYLLLDTRTIMFRFNADSLACTKYIHRLKGDGGNGTMATTTSVARGAAHSRRDTDCRSTVWICSAVYVHAEKKSELTVCISLYTRHSNTYTENVYASRRSPHKYEYDDDDGGGNNNNNGDDVDDGNSSSSGGGNWISHSEQYTRWARVWLYTISSFVLI